MTMKIQEQLTEDSYQVVLFHTENTTNNKLDKEVIKIHKRLKKDPLANLKPIKIFSEKVKFTTKNGVEYRETIEPSKLRFLSFLEK